MLWAIGSFLIISTQSLFEYKYSFKPPILDDHKNIPFYEHTGNVIPDNTRVRLVASIPNQRGLIQSKYPTNFKWWEVILDFQILGTHHVGADGMAFWFTSATGSLGYDFGRTSLSNGLAIVLDSYDNDHKYDNPSISAYVANETLEYDHNSDGGGKSIGRCNINYRNTPFSNQLRIQYYKNELIVWYVHGNVLRNGSQVMYQPMINSYGQPMTATDIMCMRIKDVYLPSQGYFGVSAMTGAFGDDHDVLSLLTFAINNDESVPAENVDSEKKKEYDEFAAELSKHQHEFLARQINGARVAQPSAQESEVDDVYSRNLQFIYTSNALIAQHLEVLTKSVDEVRKYLHDMAQHQHLPQIASQINLVSETSRYSTCHQTTQRKNGSSCARNQRNLPFKISSRSTKKRPSLYFDSNQSNSRLSFRSGLYFNDHCGLHSNGRHFHSSTALLA